MRQVQQRSGVGAAFDTCRGSGQGRKRDRQWVKTLTGRTSVTFWAVLVAIAVFGVAPRSQEIKTASNVFALPNPYTLQQDWAQLPKNIGGGVWGETIRVGIAADGNVWVFTRCMSIVPPRQASCVNRGPSNPPFLEFDPSGKLLRTFGDGIFASPHGFTIAPDGYFWAADVNIPVSLGKQRFDSFPPEVKAAAGVDAFPGDKVFKIDPKNGKVVMTLDKPGGFHQPTGVAVGANGDVFVSEGHTFGAINKFTKDGKFVKAWGQPGKGPDPGNFGDPHDIDIGGSRGWLYVADRNNNRIQVFDQDGKFIAAWPQFSRVNSVDVTKDDVIIVGSQQPDASKPNGAVRGILVGNAIDGSLKYWIPDPRYDSLKAGEVPGSSASGVTMDAMGNIYAVDVGTRNVRKYIRNK